MTVLGWRSAGERSSRSSTQGQISTTKPCSQRTTHFPALTCLMIVLRYEKEGRVKRVVKAQQLWYAIIESQTETGTPYMLYKDACNGKSNQQNLGTIKSSNLCTEIVQYTSTDEVRGWRYHVGAKSRQTDMDFGGSMSIYYIFMIQIYWPLHIFMYSVIYTAFMYENITAHTSPLHEHGC